MNGRYLFSVLLVILSSITFSHTAQSQARPPDRYITVDDIINAFQAAHIKARLLPSQLPKTVAEEVGIDDLIENSTFEIILLKCGYPTPDAVCKLVFSATLKVDSTVGADEISRLNRLSTLKVNAISMAGKPPGLNMGYTYPCMGVTDANLVSIALTFFDIEAMSVISNYKNGFASVRGKAPDTVPAPK
jgi:hypothetical protein